MKVFHFFFLIFKASFLIAFHHKSEYDKLKFQMDKMEKEFKEKTEFLLSQNQILMSQNQLLMKKLEEMELAKKET